MMVVVEHKRADPRGEGSHRRGGGAGGRERGGGHGAHVAHRPLKGLTG